MCVCEFVLLCVLYSVCVCSRDSVCEILCAMKRKMEFLFLLFMCVFVVLHLRVHASFLLRFPDFFKARMHGSCTIPCSVLCVCMFVCLHVEQRECDGRARVGEKEMVSNFWVFV